MSFEQIIFEVQARPELWCTSHWLYKNRILRAKKWKELAGKLKIKEVTLKKRWKHLKDQYRKELKKPLQRSECESFHWESTWQYFNLMSFLREEIKNIPYDGGRNIQSSESIDTRCNLYLDTEILASPLMFAASHPLAGPLSQDSPRKGKDMSKSTDKRAKESDKSLSNDEDYLFFKSILPLVRNLTELQKLQLRGKVNAWLIEAVTQNERTFYQTQAGFIKQETPLM